MGNAAAISGGGNDVPVVSEEQARRYIGAFDQRAFEEFAQTHVKYENSPPPVKRISHRQFFSLLSGSKGASLVEKIHPASERTLYAPSELYTQSMNLRCSRPLSCVRR